ncbi:1083_t:CDS:2 [Acaulospora colombiana]|uniref:1083_t:CDS:1 n=1 Tax=Acaulospora colombiana TaxID=27376 RepID=A0ACA9JZ74_9GLOM|nr:1083_t:CDS:2 [Acaulospora colombiana]
MILPTNNNKIRRQTVIDTAWEKAFLQLDIKIHYELEDQAEFVQNCLRKDSSLTESERNYLIKKLQENVDDVSVKLDIGYTRVCENCLELTHAYDYCEHCIRAYLESDFGNWTSGDDTIDDLIRKCQSNPINPSNIIENFQCVEYNTKADSLNEIHSVDLVHRDLHPGNVLLHKRSMVWYISDLGFCGPIDKPTDCIYGNLPYIAPEVIKKKKYTAKADMYSLGMIMWQLSSGRPPFHNRLHDTDLAFDIINGKRPKIVKGTPPEYVAIMRQCWNAHPEKRPDTVKILKKMNKIYMKLYNIELDNGQKSHLSIPAKVKDLFIKLFRTSKNLPAEVEIPTDLSAKPNHEIVGFIPAVSSSEFCTSQLHHFKDLPEPKNMIPDEEGIEEESEDTVQYYLEITEGMENQLENEKAANEGVLNF